MTTTTMMRPVAFKPLNPHMFPIAEALGALGALGIVAPVFIIIAMSVWIGL